MVSLANPNPFEVSPERPEPPNLSRMSRSIVWDPNLGLALLQGLINEGHVPEPDRDMEFRSMFDDEEDDDVDDVDEGDETPVAGEDGEEYAYTDDDLDRWRYID